MNKIMTTTEPTSERIKKYLLEGKRFDKRGLFDFREIKIEKNVSKKAEGSVRVKIGKTEVIVGIKLDVAAPYPDSPDKGNLMVSADMLPLSSPRFELGPPKFESIELGRVTDRGIRESGFIDFEKLCIKKGEKVWTVFVDIYSINDDGNLMDAAAMGAIAALRLARIPKYDEETGKVIYGEYENESLPLKEDSPVSISIHKIGNSFVVDPTREEEDLSECRVTLTTYEGAISSMQKSESEALTIDEIKKIFDISEETSKKILKEIEKKIK